MTFMPGHILLLSIWAWPGYIKALGGGQAEGNLMNNQIYCSGRVGQAC